MTNSSPFPHIIFERTSLRDLITAASNSLRIIFRHWRLKVIKSFFDYSYRVGVAAPPISMLRHSAGTPYNSYTHWPIYTKLITHVRGPALNTSMYQYCVISIAPPTGHRKSASNDKLHPIHMKFTRCVLYIIDYNVTCWVISSATYRTQAFLVRPSTAPCPDLHGSRGPDHRCLQL